MRITILLFKKQHINTSMTASQKAQDFALIEAARRASVGGGGPQSHKGMPSAVVAVADSGMVDIGVHRPQSCALHESKSAPGVPPGFTARRIGRFAGLPIPVFGEGGA